MESIRLFALCENMKWSHLPVAGGIYDQHPDLLDQWRYIFSVRNQHEAEEQRKRDVQNQSKSAPGSRRGRGRR